MLNKLFNKFKKNRTEKPKPTVIQAVSYFPPHLGGMENVAEQISSQLSENGWNVRVITSNIGYNDIKDKSDEDNKYRVDRLKSIEFAHTPIMPSLFFKLLFIKKPAVIHLHLAQAYLPEMIWLVSKLRRIPYIVHFHLDVEPSGRFGFIFVLYKKYIQPKVIRGAKYIIALSPQQKAMLVKKYRLSSSKVKFIPNGVSNSFLEIGDLKRNPHRPLRLLYVGRLVAQKRVERLIEAVSLVKTNVQLRIVGSGEDEEDLKTTAKILKLENVEFAGPKYGKEVEDAYINGDVFILPSDKEGMPLVLFEAMAAGLPVIGSNVQGIRDHIEGIGILVKELKPKKFAEAIDALNFHLNSWYPLMSENSHSKASKYSWSELTTKMEKLYLKAGEKLPFYHVKRFGLMSAVIAWWLAFLGLRLINGVPDFVINTIGFSFLVLVPGVLTLICLRLKMIGWAKMALSVGFSILELILVVLAGNTVLQWFGVKRPLDAQFLIPEISLLLLALIVTAWRRTYDWHLDIKAKLKELFPTGHDRFIVAIPMIFILLSVLGTNSLNNGGTDIFTMVMLIGIALYSLYLYFKSKSLSDNTIATSIFLTSVSVLFMNSLRGWYTTGHDIQLEYWVFQQAKTHGVWQIQSFRNPYNACLSITILPTVFANLLKIFDPYVYKVFFQLLFATCPAIIYLLFRKWVAPAVAFLSALYFIAFPTFFTDMSFLNRQEIAFIFFALMLLILFQDEIKTRIRQVLFLVLGLGMVLSHYSTTYSVIAILILSAAAWPVLKVIGSWLTKHTTFKLSALRAAHSSSVELRQITLIMVAALTGMSILWTVILTNTGGDTASVVTQTVDAIGSSFKQDEPRSNSTNYNLFSYSESSPSQEFKKYINASVDPARQQNNTVYYPASSYDKYQFKITTDAVQPLTRLGHWLSDVGLHVATFNYAFRQSTAKLLQILVITGFIYIIFRRTYSRLLDSDYIGLCVGSAIFVALQVVLPILSVQYGLLRAFQQSLMVLGIITVIGSIALFAWIPNKTLRHLGPVLLAIVFFLSSTGFISQTIGGYYAQLNLSNSGVYYDSYYTRAQEIAGIEWLNGVAGKTVNGKFVQSPLDIDSYTYNELAVYTPLIPTGDIYPGLVRKDAYVFMGNSNIAQDEATVEYNNDLITYKYPLQFLNSQKNLIYSNGGTDIYR